MSTAGDHLYYNQLKRKFMIKTASETRNMDNVRSAVFFQSPIFVPLRTTRDEHWAAAVDAFITSLPIHTGWIPLGDVRQSKMFIRFVIGYKESAAQNENSDIVCRFTVQVCSAAQRDACKKQEQNSRIVEDVSRLSDDCAMSNIKVSNTNTVLAKLDVSCSNCGRELLALLHKPKPLLLPCNLTFETHFELLSISCCETTENDSNFVMFEILLEEQRVVPAACPASSHLLRKLYDDTLFMDVTLRLGEKNLHAHRCVLAANSPVFKAMFEHSGFTESQQGVVDIKDVRVEVMEAALRYIYRKDFENVDTNTYKDLLILAERYQLLDLKAACEDFLSKDESIDVLQLLAVADTNNAQYLRKAAILRIINHPDKKKIFKEPAALEFFVAYPKLTQDILTRL